MCLGKVLLAATHFLILLTDSNSLQEKIGKDAEIQELGDDITLHHRNFGLKLETVWPQRRKAKIEARRFWTKRRPAFKSCCSSSKRFFPNMPYSYGSPWPYSHHIHHIGLWPTSPYGLWPQDIWKDECGYPFGGGYVGHGLGYGGWNYPFSPSSCCPCTCGHWCSKYY